MTPQHTPPHPPTDAGGAALLSIGLGVCAAMLLVGGISVTSAQLARSDALDAASHASAAAADQISADAVYRGGVTSMTVDAQQARERAQRVLAQTPRPDQVTSWRISEVTTVGNTVQVGVDATVSPPVIGSAMTALGAPVRVHVVSRADAHVAQPSGP